jgi:uncharacterized protein YcnI
MTRARRGATGLALVAALVIRWAAPGSAHVTLHSSEAVQGATDVVISIRVPDEEDNATTTGLEVDFPAATPLIGVYVQPTPGWQFQVITSDLAQPVTTDDGVVTTYVSKVTWSGGTVPVGGFQDFAIDVSTMPAIPLLEVKALQTYSNGDIVRWIDDPVPAGQPQPDHPAPTLALAHPPAGSGDAGTSSSTTVASGRVALSGLARSTSVDSARRLAIAALVVGAVALLGAAAAWAARRHGTGEE